MRTDTQPSYFGLWLSPDIWDRSDAVPRQVTRSIRVALFDVQYSAGAIRCAFFGRTLFGTTAVRRRAVPPWQIRSAFDLFGLGERGVEDVLGALEAGEDQRLHRVRRTLEEKR